MAEQASLVQDGVDRINEAYESIEEEVRRVQKQLNSRRQKIEKQFSKSRKDAERQTRKEVKRIRSEFMKNPVVKRLEGIRKDVNKQVESAVDNLLGSMQIASKADLSRLDRKLNTINRRLKGIEKARKANGAAPAAH
jgi:F0F1-type ATP synthase membrane subunit b/b'